MTNDKKELKDSKQETTKMPENENKLDQSDNWKYSSEIKPGSSVPTVDEPFEDINWSASEFIAHDKNIAWYTILILVTLVLAAIVYLLTHDKISTVIVVLAGVIFGIYAARKPRLLNYKLDNSGLTIQSKLFNYDSLKSFVVVENSAIPNIILMPLKRFMPSLSMYLDPSSEEAVIKVLSERLPQDLHQQDFIERFMLRIRF
jgi:hypothetical protein